MEQKMINGPSGLEYLIREQNGNDDDNLSRLDIDEASVLNRYLADIILKGPDGKRLTLEDVQKLRLREKYVILIKSRIFSLSEKLIFSYDWGPEIGPEEYEVNLEDYVWDYKLDFPVEGTPQYSPDRIAPYPTNDALISFNVGDHQVRFEYLDGVGERMLLGLKPSERSINANLKARKFEVHDGSKWVVVSNFAMFSAREMSQIRAKVEQYDPPVEGNAHIAHPLTGEIVDVPLIGIRDFYYPVKI